ncbi:MAG: C25 family cysteine peptidase [Caldilineaceae bacterium]
MTWTLGQQSAGISARENGGVGDGAQAPSPAMLTALAAQLAAMPQQRLNGYNLPLHLTPILLLTNEPISLRLQQDASLPWPQPLTVAAPLLPNISDSAGIDITPLRERQALPVAPVFVLREGRMRGLRIAVIAFSPLYQEQGVTKVTYQADVTIADAKVLPTTSLLFAPELSPGVGTNPNELTDTIRQLRQARPLFLEAPMTATNPVAEEAAIRLSVSAAGLQQLVGSALIANGMAAGLDLARLHLWRHGAEIPLEVDDADGRLDESSMVRFYAPPAASSMNVGDRWNATATYWLTYEQNEGLRIATRDVTPAGAPLRQSAFEEGVWEDNQLYESTMAGVDGDHWFASKLEVEAIDPNNPASNPVSGIILTPTLTLDTASQEPSLFTLTGSTRAVGQHLLYVNFDDHIESLSWSSETTYENWQHTITTTLHPTQLDLALIAGLTPSLVRIDKLFWRQPALLDLHGRGALFVGAPGSWRYTLQNLPQEGALYAITNPLRPERLLPLPASNGQFEDGPTAQRYLVAGPGTVHQPGLSLYAPTQLATPEGADVVYIAPANFQAVLAPLLELRRRQGYQARFIDVQQIYDRWSYGDVAPEAIRDFLRFAVSQWTPAPIAAVLVGDTTFDPRNYTGAQDEVANRNVVPTFLATIDPWLGETACESCFAQLDGDSPLDTAADPGFLMDIWLGRLSVQDEAQLATVVDKIVRYEQSDATALLQPGHQQALFVADNYIHPDGQRDLAGDFAYYSDLVIEGDAERNIAPMLPSAITPRRLYYDPSATGSSEPWREPDGAQARLRAIEELRQGSTLVTYHGHSNHFQWATTDPNLDPPYLLGTNDVFKLDNLTSPFVLLEMTCLTSQFPFVSPSGTTLDERFLRHDNGGAVAVWGSAGLTVSVGQDALIRGFHQQLWATPSLTARLGALTTAGYYNLFANGVCCQETRYAYLLLGDPLTPVLLWSPDKLYLPVVHSQ